MSEVIYLKRSPAMAATLSMLCLGLGHIYCGKIVTGLVLMLVMQLPIAFMLVVTVTNNINTIFLIAIVLPSIFWTLLYSYGIVDSYRLAKHIGDQYEPKDYNRGIIYALFIATNIVASLAVAPALALYIREHVAEAFVGATDSMTPAIRRGDRFLINKLLQRKLPQDGDVILFLSPKNRDIKCVRRVVGLPGDTVCVRENSVYINSKKLKHQAADTKKIIALPETKVPPAHCFVLSDKRSDATDSRQFGFVPLGDILGRAEYIYWPWSRFGSIKE